jgi:ABC-type sulfate/molybdate transport systems ATPase subunit
MSISFLDFSQAHFKHHNKALHLRGEISKSQIVAIQGPSGCGKSTLLRSLAQADEPFIDYLLDSKRVSEMKASSRKISLVFQKPLLFPHLNVIENLIFPMKFVEPWKSWSLTLRKERALEELNKLELLSKAESLPRDLSGGEAMRISLVRSLIIEPRFLLLDEPFSGLDKETKEKVKTWLKDAICKFQIPSLLVTHLEEDLADFSDKRLQWPSPSDFVLRF